MPASFPSIWNLPANPVFRRHAVARMRPLPLLSWILVTQTLAGFAWAITFFSTLRRESKQSVSWDFTSPEFRELITEHGLAAAVLAWIVVLILQMILLFFKGTFSVATGVAREASEGMMDAKRLTPLPTGHKVVGQLAGLPVQETVVAGALTIWAVLSMILGGVPAMLLIKMYLILVTCAMFYHAVGLVAGTIIRQKILAGTLSQLLVIVLNFVLPLAGYFGIGAISHLGISAAFFNLLETYFGADVSIKGMETTVLWFGHPLPAAFYTWAITVIALGLLVTIIHRRWKDEGSQLLGKPGTVVAVVALLLISLGEFHGYVPSLVELGTEEDDVIGFEIGRNSNLNNSNLNNESGVSPAWLIIPWISGFAIVLGLLNLLAATILAPSPVQRGLYRHAIRPRPWHDGAPAIPWLLGICLLTSITFHGITRPMLGTEEFQAIHPATPWLVTAAFAIPACVWLLAIVRLGWRGAALLAFFFGVLPLLLAALVAVVTADPFAQARWILAISALILPVFAWISGLAMEGYDLSGSLRQPFLVSLALHSLFLVWFALRKPAARKDAGTPA